MPQGNAFNRNEVSSVYVRPTARYVVSLIVGMDDDEADSPESAVSSMVEMIRDKNRTPIVFVVHDRETGCSQELERVIEDDSDALSSESA